MPEHKFEQGSEAWLEFRLGKVSASRVADVMAKTKSGYGASRKNYMMELLCQRLTGAREEGFTSAAMMRGTELEPIARTAYEMDKDVMVRETGCFSHDQMGSFIASPDGLVGSDGLIECKCPNTAQHVEFLRTGKIDPRYEWQMLAQLVCTGRKWCDFVSFDDRMPEELQYKCIRFERKDHLNREMDMLTEVSKFLKELDDLVAELTTKIKEAA